MRTRHRLVQADARHFRLDGSSVNLVVTSPPYPMVEMWDDSFTSISADFAELREKEPFQAWELCHSALDLVWRKCAYALKEGGLLAVNIGDAVRTLGGEFRLFPNHARITMAMLQLGLTPLPDILWRKPTNAPNKFMGSGMLPPGAYVTYEHEYILLFRQGGPRTFLADDAGRRRESAYFWDERNVWCSDVWGDVPGARQDVLPNGRRSGAFPLEIALRLISLFSVYEDVVYDPFVGTGTTTLAAIAMGRSSIGCDFNGPALTVANKRVLDSWRMEGHRVATHRLETQRFNAKEQKKPERKHLNKPHDLPVVTAQETALTIYEVSELKPIGDLEFEAEYTSLAGVK